MTQMMPDALESRTISITGDGRRLDVALSEAAGLTRSRVAALMADGNVTVDGKVETKSGAKAKQGQIVILTIPAPKPAVPIAQEIPLTILYQDDDLAVVLKPCGMVVHPAAGNEDGTLVNALLHHLDHLSGIGGELPTLEKDNITGLSVLDAFVEIGFCASKGEVRRLIKQNGIRVNDRAISDENYVFSESDIVDGQIKIAQGKKKFGLIKQAG